MEDVKVIEEFLKIRNIGYGDGSGYGSGYGIKEFNGQRVYYIDDVPTLIDQVKGNYAKGKILRKDFTLDPCYIARVENSFAHGATLREALQEAQAKALEELSEEERIAKFVEEFPTLSSTATGEQFYHWHHVLTGSCTMGRDAFCKDHGVQLDATYNVEYFLTLTQNAYGGETIRRLLKEYQD